MRTAVAVVTISTLASVLTIAPAGAQDSTTEPPPVTAAGPGDPDAPVVVLADYRSPLRPGGVTVVDGAVLNGSVNDIASPVRLILEGLPAGVTLASLTSSAGDLATVDWTCEPTTGAAAACTLVGADGAPAALGAEGLAPWQAHLAVAAEAVLPPDPTVTFTIDAGPAVAAVPAVVDLAIAGPDDVPFVVLAETANRVEGGEVTRTIVSVTNVDAEPIEAGVIVVTGLVPATATEIAPSDESIAAGWNCDTTNGEDPRCSWAGAPIATGDTTPELRVAWRAPPRSKPAPSARSSVTPSDPDSTGAPNAAEDEQLEWTLAVGTETGTATYTEPLSVGIVAAAPPEGSLLARIDGQLAVTPPATAAVEFTIHGARLDEATGPIAVEVDLPTGFSLDAGPDGWTCAPANPTVATAETADAVRCSAPSAIFDIGPDAETAVGSADDSTGPESTGADAAVADDGLVVDLTLALDDTAAPGTNEFETRLIVPGESADTTADNAALVSLVVVPPEEPALEPFALARAPGSEAFTPVRDGAPLAITPGETIALGATNHGSGIAEPGETVEIHTTLPNGIAVEAVAEDWRCESTGIGTAPLHVATDVTCRHELTTALGPGASVPPVLLDVTDVTRPDGAVLVPVRVARGSADDPDHPVSISVRGLVAVPRPTLSIAAEPIALDDDSAAVPIVVTNIGEAPTRDWSVLLDIVDDGPFAWADLGAPGEGVECEPHVAVAVGVFADWTTPEVVECRSTRRLRAGQSITLDLGITRRTGPDAGAGSDADGDGDVDGDGDGDDRTAVGPTTAAIAAVATAAESRHQVVPEPARITVSLQDDLEATAVAIPERATAGTDIVVLDARASTGAGPYEWRQVPGPDDVTLPPVAWLDVTDDGRVLGRVARFARPAAAIETAYSFELIVGSGDNADRTTVTVVVEPGPAAEVDGAVLATPVASSSPAGDGVTNRQPDPDGGRGNRPSGGPGEEVITGRAATGTGIRVAGLQHSHNTITAIAGQEAIAADSDYTVSGTSGVYVWPGEYTQGTAMPVGTMNTIPAGTTVTTDAWGPVYTRNPSNGSGVSSSSFIGWSLCTGGACAPLDMGTYQPSGPPNWDHYYSFATTASDAGRVLQAHYRLSYWNTGPVLTHIISFQLTAPVPRADTASPPTLGPAPADLGDAITTVAGSWMHSPTSLTYDFFRCPTAQLSATGCTDLGATQTVGLAGAASYTPAAADAGSFITVRETAANAAGPSYPGPGVSEGAAWVSIAAFSEPVVESAVSSVSYPTMGIPATITLGSYAPTSTVTAHQWLRCTSGAATNCQSIAGATAETYTPVAADVGEYLAVRQTLTSAAGSRNFTTAGRLVAGAPAVDTAVPAVAVTQPSAGVHRFTTTDGTWTGVHEAATSRQFWRCTTSAATSCTAIAGATGTSYDIVAADVGQWIQSRVTITNFSGTAQAVAATAVSVPVQVASPMPVATATAQASTAPGGPTVGSAVTAQNGTWLWAGAGFTQQWQRCSSPGVAAAGSGCTDIAGATGASRTLALADDGAYLRVVVSTTNIWGQTASSTSTVVGPVVAETPTNTAAPTTAITGAHAVPRVGMTLTATRGAWTSPATDPLEASGAWAHQWQRCATDATSCVDIAGATGLSRVVTTADIGHRFRVVETVETASGLATSATSVLTAVVTTGAPDLGGAPTVPSNPVLDETLTGGLGSWTSWDGTTPALTWSWQTCTAPATCATVATGSGPTAPTYTALDPDLGTTMRLVVTATNAHGSTEAISNVSAAVANRAAPIATTDAPGGHIDAAAGTTVTITGGGSGTGALTTTWVQTGGPTVLATPSSDPVLSFTTPTTGSGTFTFTFTVTQADLQSDTVTVTVDWQEAPTVAIDQGDAIDIVGGVATTITASGTGIAPLTYVWTQTGGESVLDGPETGAALTFAAPVIGDATMTFEVEVTDGLGVRTTDTIVVAYRQPVTITSDGGPFSVAGGVDITIVGEATGSGALTYLWEQLPGDAGGEPVTLTVDGASVTFTTPATGIGAITLRLTVTAANGETTSTDVVVAYAQPAGVTIAPGGPIEVTGGTTTTVTANATGVGPFTYVWTQLDGPEVIGGVITTQVLTVTPPATGDGVLAFDVGITTADGQTANDTVVITYRQPAIVTSVAPTDRPSVTNGSTVTLSGAGTALAPAVGTWSQTSGVSVLTTPVDAGSVDVVVPSTGRGTLGFRYTIAGANGATAHRDVLIDYAPPPADPAPAGMCIAVDAVRSPGTTVSLGDRIRFATGSGAIRGDCNADLTASFSRATLSVDGVFTLADAAGTITRDGLRVTSGTLTVADGAFAGLRFRLVGDGLTIAFGGAAFAVAGSVVGPGLALVPAPRGWNAATRIDFTAGPAGGQRIALAAIAHRDDGTAPAVVDALPAPAPTTPALRIAGAYRSGGGVTLEASVTGLVRLGDAAISLAGSVSRADRGSPITTTITASTADPIVLGDDLVLSRAALAWTDGTVTGSATLRVADRFDIEGAITVSARDQWQVDVAAGTEQTVTLAPGLRLGGATVNGSVARSGDRVDANLAVATASWSPADSLTLTDVAASLTLSCRIGGSCSPTVSLAATVAVSLDATVTSGRISGTVDPATGAYTLDATLGRVDPVPGLAVRSLALRITSDGAGTRTMALGFDGSIVGTAVTGSIDIGRDGWSLTVDMERLSLFPGAPTLLDPELTYASTDRVLRVSGGMVAPSWLADIGLGSGRVDVVGSVALDTSTIDLAVTLADLGRARLVDAAGVTIDAEAITLGVAGNPTTGASFRLAGDVILGLPAIPGGSPTSIPLVLSAGIEPATGTLDASLALRDGTRWDDAFGLSGLDIIGLAVSLQGSLGGGGTTIGLAGSAVLPPAIADPLGIADDTPITLAARLGAGTPCFAFEIGDGTRTAIDVIDAGIVVADQASFVIAPSGCRIGPYTYPAGMSFGFSGTAFEIPVDAAVTVEPRTAALDATIRVGTIGIAGLTLDDVTLTLASSATRQELALAGSATFLGATATVDGAFSRSATGTHLRLAGTFSGVDVGGFELGELAVDMVATDNFTNLDIAGRSSVSILGTDVDTTFAFESHNGRIDRATGTGVLDADLGELAIDATVDVDLIRGRFPDIAIDGAIAIGDIELSRVQGRVNAKGVSLLGSLRIDPIIDARLGGWIAYGHQALGAGSSQRTTSAQMVAIAVPDDARPGDFEFTADNIGLGVAGFDMRGNVEIGARNGVVRARLGAHAQLGVGNAVDARVSFDGELQTSGAIDMTGTGALVIAGQRMANARFGAFAHPDGRSGVSVDATVDVLGAQAQLVGAFQRDPEHGTLFRLHGATEIGVGGFDFGTTNLVLYRDVAPPSRPQTPPRRLPSWLSIFDGLFDPGVDRSQLLPEDLQALALETGITPKPLIADACLRPRQRCAVRSGLLGAADLQIPKVGSFEVTMAIGGDGSVAVDAVTRLNGPLGDALKRPTVNIAIRLDANGNGIMTLRGRVGNVFGIPVSFTIDGSLTTAGRLRLSATAASGPMESPTVNIGVAKAYAGADGTFRLALDIDTTRSRIAGSATLIASAFVRVAYREVWTLGASWSSYHTILSLRADGTTPPPEVTIRVDIIVATISLTLRLL